MLNAGRRSPRDTASRPRIAMVLQARMGSTRLPGKSMLPLAGEPLVGRILERVKRCETLDAIVVATTEKAEDDSIVGVAADWSVQAFRGSETDLLDRHLGAARAVESDIIVRLPADNPVPEPEEIDRIVRYYLDAEVDFASNLSPMLGNGYPDGIGAEVFSVASLERAARTTTGDRHHEHPHLNFFDYTLQRPASPAVRVGTVECPRAFSRPDLKLDVNTAEDYEFMAALYSALYDTNPTFHITDIIQWYDLRPRA